MDIEERLAAALAVLGSTEVEPQLRCSTGKRMYRTKQEARLNKDNHEHRTSLRKRNIHFEPYRCKECDWWHLSTKK